jgi:hypothetical protein
MLVNILMMAAALSPPRLLTTNELKSLLVGSFITRADLPKDQTAADEPEYFFRGGGYRIDADNYEARGRYHIERGLICVLLEDEKKETCRFVILDPIGKYWIVKSMSPPDYKNIRVSKITR